MLGGIKIEKQGNIPNINIINYKKFWEELIAYFPSYDMGHNENLEPRGRCVDPALQTKVVTFSFYSDRGGGDAATRGGALQHSRCYPGAAQIYSSLVQALPGRSAVDVDSALRAFHGVDVSNIVEVSGAHAASTFRINMCRVNESSCMVLRKRELSKYVISASHNCPYLKDQMKTRLSHFPMQCIAAVSSPPERRRLVTTLVSVTPQIDRFWSDTREELCGWYEVLARGMLSFLTLFITHFDSEDGGRKYLRNVGNITHIHTVQRPKRIISINCSHQTVFERILTGLDFNDRLLS
jgi:hypothetical protein